MRFHYYPETDSLNIDLAERPGTEGHLPPFLDPARLSQRSAPIWTLVEAEGRMDWMPRRKGKKKPAPHHSVYLVELDPKVREKRKHQRLNPDADPDRLCLYVGMTGLAPEERFENHKAGYRASPAVRDYGIQLLPEWTEDLNNLPYDEAVEAEAHLAEILRQEGYFVVGGH